MNILIVGSNSFIGKNLTKKLKKNNKVFSTSKNSKNKYYLDLNYPQNMKLNLEEIVAWVNELVKLTHEPIFRITSHTVISKR